MGVTRLGRVFTRMRESVNRSVGARNPVLGCETCFVTPTCREAVLARPSSRLALGVVVRADADESSDRLTRYNEGNIGKDILVRQIDGLVLNHRVTT